MPCVRSNICVVVCGVLDGKKGELSPTRLLLIFAYDSALCSAAAPSAVVPATCLSVSDLSGDAAGD